MPMCFPFMLGLDTIMHIGKHRARSKVSIWIRRLAMPKERRTYNTSSMLFHFYRNLGTHSGITID